MRSSEPRHAVDVGFTLQWQYCFFFFYELPTPVQPSFPPADVCPNFPINSIIVNIMYTTITRSDQTIIYIVIFLHLHPNVPLYKQHTFCIDFDPF